MQVSLRHPFTMLVAGSTSCGKTHFVKRLIERAHLLCDPSPDEIIYCYGEYQPLYDEFPVNVSFVEGVPIDFEKFDPATPRWVIIDDLMQEVGDDRKIANLFSKGSHHRNISVILIVQNFFHRGKQHRNISLNSHYIVLFKNPRDSSVATNLAKQVAPKNNTEFVWAYSDATRNPYSYLFLDLKPDTPNNLRFLSNITGEGPLYSYQILTE